MTGHGRASPQSYTQTRMQTPAENPATRHVYSVSTLNREARAILEGSFPSIWVEGEISNLARPASGHLYFSLKDANAQVRCALFKNRALHLKTAPENGMQVLVRAGVSLYEGRGEFQLIIEYLEPAGAGALQRAFEELKRKLDAEGLFDPAHKKPIPAMPRRIGVVTSPSGAAIRDVLNVLGRRYPAVRIIIYPVPVQGTDASARIIRMLQIAEQRNEVDVLLLTRGGGSLEDLWAFNDEQLARTIYKLQLPIVCGVGHEIDFTIADFVADQRAPTPSAAAELLSPDQELLLRQIERQRTQLVRLMQQRISAQANQLQYFKCRLPHPLRLLEQSAQRLDDLSLRGQRALRSALQTKNARLARLIALLAGQNPRRLLRQKIERCMLIDSSLRRAVKSRIRYFDDRLEQLAHNLNTVSPLSTLSRGYAIVQQNDGTVVRDTKQLSIGKRLEARFGKGTATLITESIHSGKENQIVDEQ